jgi:hypothetical protein
VRVEADGNTRGANSLLVLFKCFRLLMLTRS